jgi:hypothetical protein
MAGKKLSMRFELGNGMRQGADVDRAVAIYVTPQTTYSDRRGYGVMPSGDLRVETTTVGRESLVSDSGFMWAMRLGEGNYCVTVGLAGAKGGSVTTVKAEARRLMVAEQHVPAGEVVVRSFMVNVRTSALSNGNSVEINDREQGSATWDDRLTLDPAHPPAPQTGSVPASSIFNLSAPEEN